MTENKDPLLLDHEADGITELDNLLPRWWLYLFYITIGFAIVYVIHFHVLHTGDLSAAEYDKEMALAKKVAAAAPAAVADAPSADATVLAQGKDLFAKNCLACHAPQAQGLIGPNLTDEYWIHGGEYANIINTIREGVPAKGMITWKAVMKPDDIQAVASYIWSIYGSVGTNAVVPPPKPPEPEARKYERPV